MVVGCGLMAQPPNDLCANAIQIDCELSGTFDGTDMTNNVSGVGAPCTDFDGVWFVIEGNGGELNITSSVNDIFFAIDEATAVSLFAGSCGSLTCVAGDLSGFWRYSIGKCDFQHHRWNGTTTSILVHMLLVLGGVFNPDFDLEVDLEDVENPTAICPSIPDLLLDGSGNATLSANAASGDLSTDDCDDDLTETSPATQLNLCKFIEQSSVSNPYCHG